jgi:RND superfamily putative drug exporter
VIVLGGPLAVYHEIGSAIENRQLMAAIVTLLIMAIVIYLLFRSLLSALLAVCGSLLAFASAIGALVQFSGPGTSGILLGNVPYIESWVPIVMFCVVVGTGIDYFIFVMSGIIAAPADDPQAIQSGMKQVAPVVITAAAIMVIVFGGFAFGKISAIRQLGTGLAICVFIDAFIVRLYLLPLAASIANHGGYRLSRESGWLSRRIER